MECTNQDIAEVPGVLLECIIVDTEAKCFYVLNHKHSGYPCIAFAERVDLPDIRSELCYFLDTGVIPTAGPSIEGWLWGFIITVLDNVRVQEEIQHADV